MTKKILVIEDDAAISAVVTSALHDEGLLVDRCASVAKRDQLLQDNSYDAIISDVMLEDGDGIDTLDQALATHGRVPVIILSAKNTLDMAVRASAAGAYEYFPKPFDLNELVAMVKKSVAVSGKVAQSKAKPQNEENSLPLVGRSQAMQNVYRMITRVLHNDLSVLVMGESGTGKELVAEAIHQLGHRQSAPFVAVNMAAIPADLIESELFGHEKGAFTGAIQQNIGKFEQANGGTLFLDEIGDMPAAAQTRLLRTLQTGRITRIGGNSEIELDVRIIAATHRDFAELIADGQFREDLYYRINVVPIILPPLRDRASDIPSLIAHFAKEATEQGLPFCEFTAAAYDIMQQQYWRGNVRELRNFVFRSVALSRDNIIDLDNIMRLLENSPAAQMDADQQPSTLNTLWEKLVTDIITTENFQDGALYQQMLVTMEKPLLRQIMAYTKGNQMKAAKILGINRNTLRKKLQENNIIT